MGDYVIAGHVPAGWIAALRQEQPAIRGLAVSGMAIDSPGMEGPNPQRYAIVAFDAAGNAWELATRRGSATR